jgi:hydroxymethylglutaryl-CoA lyase
MLKSIPKKIEIVEVGPRDGLQNEKKKINTIDKVKYISLLKDAGLKKIEATSFVKKDKIPQLGDAEELFAKLKKKKWFNDVSLPCLVPNMKGLLRAEELGVSEISVFTSVSDTFNKKNTNISVDESLKVIASLSKAARGSGIKIRGYISTVFGCPYEGETSLILLERVCKTLFDLGIYQVSLGDTIGTGNPKKVVEVIDVVSKIQSKDCFAMHFHDTFGLAMANVLTSLELGIINYDASSGGLGGCPYAKGASGNLATEDLVYLSESMGIETGINLLKLKKASKFILSKLKKTSPSKWYLAQEKK